MIATRTPQQRYNDEWDELGDRIVRAAASLAALERRTHDPARREHLAAKAAEVRAAHRMWAADDGDFVRSHPRQRLDAMLSAAAASSTSEGYALVLGYLREC